MTEPMITAANVDLSNCDQEQVQFSGAVQPHACLLVVEEPSLAVIQASSNTAELLGIAYDKLIGSPLRAVLGKRADDMASRLAREPLDNGPVHLACLAAAETRSSRPLNVFAHRCSGSTIFELEVIPRGAERPMLDLYSELRATIGKLQSTRSLQSFFDTAVTYIRHFTGFERVMAYQFLEDGCGDVIAGTWVVEAQRRKLGEALSVSAPVAASDQAYTFSSEELAVYGEYELQTLERVLRDGRGTALDDVADAISRKIGRPYPTGAERVFLESYYLQLRAQLEQGLRLGKRKADKYAA